MSSKADPDRYPEMTKDWTIAVAMEYFQPLLDVMAEPMRASMAALIQAIAVAAYEYEEKQDLKLRYMSSTDEDDLRRAFDASKLEGQEKVEDEVEAEVETEAQEQSQERAEGEASQAFNNESQSKVTVTTSRTVEETIQGTAHQFKSLTITFEIQDQAQDQDQDSDENEEKQDDTPEDSDFYEEEEKILFTAPTGVEADLNEVYEVFWSIDVDRDNPEERKRFAEELVRKCQEKGWI